MSESDRIQRLEKQLAESNRERDAAKAALSETDATIPEKDPASQPTILEEYLRYCHEHLFKSLRIRNALLLAKHKKATTSVNDKYYPLKLRPWNDFLSSQRIHYDVIREVLGDTRLLPPLLVVEWAAKGAHGAYVSSEPDLKKFEDTALEGPVERIYDIFGPRCQSHRMTQGLERFKIIFRHQLDDLQEKDYDENSERVGRASQKRREQSRREQEEPRLGIPDKWCARWIMDGETDPDNDLGEERIFPIEYKAAHKITAQDFEAALQKEDLFCRVLPNVSSHKSATGDDGVHDRNEEKVAKALAQTFHYMVCCQSTFGYLTSGKSLIFLRIDEDARVLYHHMVQPDKDAEGEEIDPFFTGVAQLSTFCLQSLLDPGKTDEWLTRQQSRLQQWPNLYPGMREPTADSPPSSPKAPSTTSYVPSSPSSRNHPSQSPPRRLTRSSCKDTEVVEEGGGSGDTDSDEDHCSDDTGIQPPMTAALGGSRKRKKGAPDSDHSASTDGSSFDLDAQQYCTQVCLLGLKRRGLLDENCPNVALHRSPEGGSRHRIGVSEFMQFLDAQMSKPFYRYRYCRPVKGKYGARGQLFKLSLRKHGYTFVGKGTFAAAVPSIEHESEVYSRLDSLQGHVVPVCLGSIALQTPYPLRMAFIVHMLLLSWGGDQMAKGAYADDQQQSLQSLLLTHGVSHNDMRHRNMLWNEERGAAMVIDFDCATMEMLAKHKQLLKLSGKRKRRASDAGVSRRKAIPSSGV